MTQDHHLEHSHQTNKTVNDQKGDDDDASSTSGSNVSAKNSGTKNSKSPSSSTKLQQTDRRIKQSNKSTIGKRSSTGAIVKVPTIERDQKNRKIRKDVEQNSELIVGNRSDRNSSSPCPDDKARETEMTVINPPGGNENIRDSIRSDVVDNLKVSSGDTINVIEVDSDRLKLPVAENVPSSSIDTDLQSSGGSTSGKSPTSSQHKNNNNNNSSNKDSNVTAEKKESSEDLEKIQRENNGCVDVENIGSEVGSSDNRESRIKRIPKTDDPIERLNALRANISSTLKEVKAVLDKHTPPQRQVDESGAAKVGDEGAVKFRFVRRVRSKSFIKFDDEEIICNVQAESSSPKTEEKDAKQGITEKINDQSRESSEAVKKVDERPKEEASTEITKDADKTPPVANTLRRKSLTVKFDDNKNKKDGPQTGLTGKNKKDDPDETPKSKNTPNQSEAESTAKENEILLITNKEVKHENDLKMKNAAQLQSNKTEIQKNTMQVAQNESSAPSSDVTTAETAVLKLKEPQTDSNSKAISPDKHEKSSTAKEKKNSLKSNLVDENIRPETKAAETAKTSSDQNVKTAPNLKHVKGDEIPKGKWQVDKKKPSEKHTDKKKTEATDEKYPSNTHTVEQKAELHQVKLGETIALLGDVQLPEKTKENEIEPKSGKVLESPENSRKIENKKIVKNSEEIKTPVLPKDVKIPEATKDDENKSGLKHIQAKRPEKPVEPTNSRKPVNNKSAGKSQIPTPISAKNSKDSEKVKKNDIKTDPKHAEEKVAKKPVESHNSNKAVDNKDVGKSGEISKDSKVQKESKENEAKCDSKFVQGKVSKRQAESQNSLKPNDNKIAGKVKEQKIETSAENVVKAAEVKSKTDRSEMSQSKVSSVSIEKMETPKPLQLKKDEKLSDKKPLNEPKSSDTKIETKTATEKDTKNKKDILKQTDLQVAEKVSTNKTTEKSTETHDKTKSTPQKVLEKPPKSPSEKENKTSVQVNSAEIQTIQNKVNAVVQSAVDDSEALTEAISSQRVLSTATSDVNSSKIEGSLNEKVNLDLKSHPAKSASPVQSKPPLQPVRKPVETCTNIEEKVLEILGQKREEKRTMIPQPETKKLEAEGKAPTLASENLPAVTSTGEKSTDKVAELTPSSSPKTISKDKPGNSVKISASKPPVILRTKRGSLAELPKDVIKDTVLKPKRSSIGSESELAKLATKVAIDPAKETVTTEVVPQKPPKITRQSSLDSESKKTKSATASDTTNTQNSGIENATNTSGASTKTINQSDIKAAVATNSIVVVKDAPSASVHSKNDSTTEIIQTPSSFASIQPTKSETISIKPSGSDAANIPMVQSEKSLDVIKPLISSADKLVSSEGVGPGNTDSAKGSPSKMTVVKKDIVSNISPSQPIDNLNMKAKESHGISESLQNNLEALSKYSAADSKTLKDSLVPKDESLIVLNGEVKPKDISIPVVEQVPVETKRSRLVKTDSLEKIKGNEQQNDSSVHSKNKASQTPAKLAFAGVNKKGLTSLVKKDDDSATVSKSEDAKLPATTNEPSLTKSDEVPSKTGPENEAKPTLTIIPNESINAVEPRPSDPDSPTDDAHKIPLQRSASTDTDDLTLTGESESDSGAKSPTAKKVRKTKKVIIKRVKRRLSLVDEAVPEPEVCEKPIEEEIPEEPVEEEPPAPKGPKSCLARRSYEPGDIVLYADRIRKNVVKWKKATVLEKITDHSYKIAYEDMQKPAHISYIKKFTNKKVQFGGKEYLEIDYAQDEYESSDEEEPYNIWARV